MKTSCCIILSCLTGFLFADPLVLKSAEFNVRPSFTATLIPEQAVPIAVPAKEWATFTILEIVPHGSYVEKDQVLVRFDDESYLKKLRDAESAAVAGKLNLANAEADFSSAEKYLPMQLQSSKIKAADAAEAWEYFRKTRRDADTKEANLSLRQSELRLDSEREELKQLEKMYKADDLTENTEEIILKRQHEMVKAYEVTLELAKLAHTRQLEVTLPREAVQLERDAQSSAIALMENEQNLPRNLELKRIALEDARVSAKRSAEALAALQAEKELFALKAPVSGYFYYGSMQDGRWTTGEPVKSLVPFSPVAVKRPFAVVVPDKVKLLMEATVEENVVRAIKPDLKGFASMTGRAEVSFPVSVVSVAKTPGIDGRYRVTLTAGYPTELPLVAGMTANVLLTTYEAKSAISVPVAALTAKGDGGWEVKLSAESGVVNQVLVKRGWTWAGKVEILSGLSEGQKIIVPTP